MTTTDRITSTTAPGPTRARELPSRDCPSCGGPRTMSGRVVPHGIHVVRWRCHRCGTSLTTQGRDC
jgi:hypothetical protein